VATAVQVANGETGLTRSQTRRLADALRGRSVAATEQGAQVTPRELEILQTLDRGLSVKQAAKELAVSPRTIENTRRVLYRKLGVRNRAEAIATAYANGIIGKS
jgi:DNA-binding NarL/FixJ family response regulator